MLKYKDNCVSKMRKDSPIFYEIYGISVVLSYLGLIVAICYFLGFAYGASMKIYYPIAFTTIWSYFFYFYLICELRFRFVGLIKIKDDMKYNILTAIWATVFTIINTFIFY